MEHVLLVYEQITAWFLQQMESNELKGGELLPSEAECMRRFDVSRGTVRKAYSYLVNNGYARTVRGKGIYVADNVLEALAGRREEKLKDVTARKIALVISGKEGFYTPIYEGVSENIRKNRWELVVMYNRTLDEERECIRNILKRKDIDGMLILPVRVKDERRVDFYSAVSHRNIPIVVIGKPPHGMLAPSVLVDDSITVYSMIEECHRKDCKNCVIFYESSEGELAFSNRLRAYYIAMARYYPTRKPVVIDIDREGWTAEAETFLRDSGEKVGFIFFNGNAIRPIFDLIGNAGKRLREDVAVIGYGPEQEYPFLDKKLSVMEIPKYELGLKSVEMLFEQMASEKRDFVKNIIFAAKYLEGETS